MGRKPYKDPKDVRLDSFAMRVNAEERRMLVALAERLQRTQSDTVRLLIREAARGLTQHAADQHGVAQTRQCGKMQERGAYE